MSLVALLEKARTLNAAAEANPLPFLRWTQPQQDFYLSPALRKSMRGGNQIGKSYGGCRWIIDLCNGDHPHQFRKPPIEAWVVCTSWSQSVAIMRKLWGMLDKSRVDVKASSTFTVRNGLGKDNPTVIFKNGSVLRFRTTLQGAQSMQGATVHAVLIDEPTDIDIYRELDRRLMRTGGQLGITFTPANRDCRWLRELTESGIISETHAKLTVENLTPIGAEEPFRLHDGTLMDQAWIDEQWRTTPDIYAAVVLDGDWTGKPIGQFFKPFDRGLHVSASKRLSPARGPVRLCLGLDHAAAGREYGQACVLSQVQQFVAGDGRTREAINVLDEVVMIGSASSQQFGREIANMLRRHGLAWRDLWQSWGDIPASSRVAWKSNQEVERAVALAFGFPVNAMTPRIRNAKEGRSAAGLLDSGCRYLYEGLVDDLLVIHPRCERLITAFETWTYDPKEEVKDVIDALRYSLKSFILPRHTGPNVGVRIG